MSNKKTRKTICSSNNEDILAAVMVMVDIFSHLKKSFKTYSAIGQSNATFMFSESLFKTITTFHHSMKNYLRIVLKMQTCLKAKLRRSVLQFRGMENSVEFSTQQIPLLSRRTISRLLSENLAMNHKL